MHTDGDGITLEDIHETIKENLMGEKLKRLRKERDDDDKTNKDDKRRRTKSD